MSKNEGWKRRSEEGKKEGKQLLLIVNHDNGLVVSQTYKLVFVDSMSTFVFGNSGTVFFLPWS